MKNTHLLLAVFALALIPKAAGDNVDLTKVQIVTPEKAPEPVVFAAEELKTHLDAITGGDHVIVHSVPEGPAIILGDGPEARKAGIDAGQIKRDGYVIKTVGNKILIVGQDDSGPKTDIKAKLAEMRKLEKSSSVRFLGSPDRWLFHRGTLYGVYRFLEELGVRWFFPGPKGTVIPKNPNASVAELDIVEEPRFETRQVGGFIRKLDAPSRRYTMNLEEFEELGFTPEANALWQLRQRWSSFFLPMNHRPPRMCYVERFAESKPEMFALLKNGKRDIDLTNKSYRSHLCYGNPETLEETLEDVDAFAEGKPAVDIGIPKDRAGRYPDNNGYSPNVCLGNSVSLLPMDSYRRCHCELCEKYFDSKTGADKKSSNYPGANSKYVWSFIDRCARELKKRQPDMNVVCLAYSSYSEPYEGMKKLPDNVIVGHCPAYLVRPYLPLNPEKFDVLKKQLAEWEGKTTRPMAFWAHYLFRNARPQHYGVPAHAPEATAEYIREVAKHCDWAFIQLDRDSVMFDAFNRYLLTRLLYNPNLDPDALLVDFTNTYFGPKAGPVIKAIYDDVGKRFADLYRANAGRIDIWEKYFPKKALDGYRKKLAEAAAMTKGTPYAERVDLFSRHYVGLMEKGYEKYDKNIRRVMKGKGGRSKVAFTREPVVIDGELGDPIWNLAPTVSLGNNVDGKPTQYKTLVRLGADENNFYAAFICHDSLNLNPSLKEGEADYVEIFLDPDHDHNGYYQILIDKAGRITDVFFEGNGEQGQTAWRSEAKAAVKEHQNHWVVEVAVPRKNMDHAAYKSRGQQTWGANFCRTQRKTREGHEKDRFSRWSPILFGKFHQPDLFGHVFVP